MQCMEQNGQLGDVISIDGWLANLGKDVASGELSHIATPIFVDSQ